MTAERISFRETGQVDMGRDPVGNALFRLALPAIATMLFHTLFHLVDTIFVSWLGEASLAAMSLTFPVMFVLFALSNGITVGNTTLVSQHLGGERPEEARETGRAALTLVLLAGLAFVGLLPRPVSSWFFTLLGATPEVAAECHRYAFWLILGAPLMGMALVTDSMFRSQGNTVVPMYSMILGNGVNILLDPLFIFTFGWGITGASVATFIGRIVSLAYLAVQIRRKSRFDFPLRPCYHPSFWRRWKQILRIGLPVTVAQSSMSLGIMGFNKVLSLFGTEAIGAWMIGNRIEGLAFLPVFGLNSALTPFIGHNVGAAQLDRVKEGMRLAWITASIMMLSIGAVLFIYPYPLLILFQPSPEVASMAVASIRASAAGYVFAALEITLMAFFQGTGYTLYGMISQIIRTVVVRVPAAYALGMLWGIGAVWWAQPLSSLASFGFSLFFFVRVFRKLAEEAPAAEEAVEGEGI